MAGAWGRRHGGPVTVLGGEGLVREVTVRSLTDSGLRVLEGNVPADDADGPAGGRGVVVLIDPAPQHWDEIDVVVSAVILISGSRLDDGAVVEAVRRGADAVLDAGSDPGRVVEAVEVVSGGGTLLGSAHTRALAEALRNGAGAVTATITLTRRETDILLSIERGESVKQTARVLGISLKTVENLQSRMFRKLGARNRAQAVAQAHAMGLLPPHE